MLLNIEVFIIGLPLRIRTATKDFGDPCATVTPMGEYTVQIFYLIEHDATFC